MQQKSRSAGNVVNFSLDFSDEQDKIWFNIEINPDNNATSSAQLARASFNQQFNQAIVPNPADYYCVIPKFSIPTSLIPVFVPDFLPSSTDTVYSVTLSYNGISDTESVVYIPQTDVAINDEFYPFVYNYSDFIDMINTALDVAFANISPPGGSLAPYFQFSPETGLFSLVAQRAYYDSTLALPVTISVNNKLAILLAGFPGISYPNSVGDSDFTFNIIDLKNNWYNPSNLAPTSPGDYYIMTQNYSTLQAWSPIKSIRLTTTTIPIKKEFITTVNNTTTLSGIGVLQNFIPLMVVGEPRPNNVNYVATQYHLVNMTGSVPLAFLDFNFVWVDGNQVEHPIYVPYNTACSLEIAFFKKSTFTS